MCIYTALFCIWGFVINQDLFPVFISPKKQDLSHQANLLMEFNTQINVIQTTYFPSLVNTLDHPVDLAVYLHQTKQRPKIVADILK